MYHTVPSQKTNPFASDANAKIEITVKQYFRQHPFKCLVYCRRRIHSQYRSQLAWLRLQPQQSPQVLDEGSQHKCWSNHAKASLGDDLVESSQQTRSHRHEQLFSVARILMKTPVMETKWQDSKCLANIIIGARIIFGVLSALTWQQLRSCGTLLKRSTLVPCHEWIYRFHFIFLFEVCIYLLPVLHQEDAKSISKSTFDSPSQCGIYLHYEKK